VSVYLLPEVPMESSKRLTLGSRSNKLSGVGEEVKLHELPNETKWSVMRGRGWGEE
jgi:hypothetical protein